MDTKLFSVWEGVYQSFEEAGGDFDAFDTDIWIEKQKKRALTYHEWLSVSENSIPTPAVSKDYPLPLVVSMLLSSKKEISVIDFGGGMGTQYLEVLSKVPGVKNKLKYFIVDSNATISNVPEEVKNYKNLFFFENFEEIDQTFDIIHIGSVLPYIKNWQKLLNGLVERFKSKYLVFSDLLAGEVPTFVTHQIFYEKKIPHWFINFKELTKVIEKDYRQIYCSKFVHKILEQEEVFPNFALPEKYRIDRAMNVVFYRK